MKGVVRACVQFQKFDVVFVVVTVSSVHKSLLEKSLQFQDQGFTGNVDKRANAQNNHIYEKEASLVWVPGCSKIGVLALIWQQIRQNGVF